MSAVIRRISKNALDAALGRTRRIRSRNSVLLTFDDGPHPDVTPAVLDRLKAFDARAIFFIVGNRIPKAPSVLARILEDGHVIGNHTYSHHLDADRWLLAYARDICACQQALMDITGHRPKLFRAPMGRYSFSAMLAPVLLGMKHVLWSADSRDWELRCETTARVRAEQFSLTVRAGDIVLLHDDTPHVLTVLDVLLPALAQRDFDLASGIQQF